MIRSNRIAPDKWMHYASCLTIAVLVGMIAWYVGLIAALLAGILKELWDSSKDDNYFCWDDMKANAVGAIVGTIPHVVALL